MIRLTKKVRQKILDQNEGFTSRSSYDSRNHSYTRDYKIENGNLSIREVGKTSWSDSRYNNTWIADDEETHRFLYQHLDKLSYEDKED